MSGVAYDIRDQINIEKQIEMKKMKEQEEEEAASTPRFVDKE